MGAEVSSKFKNGCRVNVRVLGGTAVLVGKVDRGWSDLGRPRVTHNDEELIPVHLDGSSYVSWHLPDSLEEVEPEVSESEKLPNGTVVRCTRDTTLPSVAIKGLDQWMFAGSSARIHSVAWVDDGSYEILVPESRSPRVFSAGDPEPGPEVTHVDDGHDVWHRLPDGWRYTTSDGYESGTCRWAHVLIWRGDDGVRDVSEKYR